MTKALVLVGHPNRESFNGALAQAYARGFEGAGGVVEALHLTELSFDPILRGGFKKDQSLEPDLLRVRSAFERARHVVWVFPTYWGSMPAVVRGLIDRLFMPGWAFSTRGGRFQRGFWQAALPAS